MCKGEFQHNNCEEPALCCHTGALLAQGLKSELALEGDGEGGRVKLMSTFPCVGEGGREHAREVGGGYNASLNSVSTLTQSSSVIPQLLLVFVSRRAERGTTWW